MKNLKFKIYNLKFAISRSDMQSPACQKPLAYKVIWRQENKVTRNVAVALPCDKKM